jgi:hypothetical protein
MRWRLPQVNPTPPNEKMLATAMRIGEEAVTKRIALEVKVRRLRWHIYKARHQLTIGKAQEALETLDFVLEMMLRDGG